MTLQADMSDLDSQVYEESEMALEAIGKEGLPALAIFSPADPKKPIVLHNGWTKSTLLKQLNIVIDENSKAPGDSVSSR